MNGEIPVSNKGEYEERAGSEDAPAERCGLGKWRPDFLQCCANIRMLTLVLTFSSMFKSVKDFYITSILTTVERQFGFPSSLTGIIKNMDNIGFMAVVICVNHLFRNSNKPRVFAASILLTSFGVLLMSLPQFVYGVPDVNMPRNMTSSSKHNYTSLCNEATRENIGTDGCREKSSFGIFNLGAFVIFVVAQLIIGMASTPLSVLSLTFIDDNVSKKNSPAYLGFMFSGGRALCPLIGFLLGAWTTSIYVDLTPQTMSRSDPRWIGAWWLGFLIIGVLSGLWALPMIMFPAGLNKKTAEQSQVENVVDNLKDLPRAFGRILWNPVYPFLLTGVCSTILLVGFAVFLPKFLQTEFGFPVSTVNIILGGVMTVSGFVGPILSGLVMSRFSLGVPASLKLASILLLMCVILQTSLMAFSCEQASWSGEQYHSTSLLFQQSCNANCTCSAAMFDPVCGSDDINYISPCHAGCSTMLSNSSSIGKEYADCGCIPGGRAKPGVCRSSCGMAIAYIAVFLIYWLINTFTVIPVFTSVMRCVSPKDKALAVAGSMAPFSLMGFIGPVLFGSVIDTTCVLRASKCGGPQACLLYDRAGFRFRLHALAGGVKMITFICYFIAWIGSKRLKPEVISEREITDRNVTKPDANGHQMNSMFSQYKNDRTMNEEEGTPMLKTSEPV